MTEASDAFDDLLWVLFFANEEHGVADELEIESKRFINLTDETEEITHCASTGKKFDLRSGDLGFSLKDCLDSGFSGIVWESRCVRIAEVLTVIFLQTLWLLKWCPPRRFSFLKLDLSSQLLMNGDANPG